MKNSTSLNLRYKALNAMGEIFVYYSVNLLNAFFLVKEGTNNKNLDIILFAYSRGVGKSLFCCRGPNDTQVMSVCLYHVKAIDFPSQSLPLYAVKNSYTIPSK